VGRCREDIAHHENRVRKIERKHSLSWRLRTWEVT